MAETTAQLIDELNKVLLGAQTAMKTFADQVQTGDKVLKQATNSIKGFADALNSNFLR